MDETPGDEVGIEEGRTLLDESKERLRLLLHVAKEISRRHEGGDDVSLRDIVSVSVEASRARRTVSEEINSYERRELEQRGLLKTSEIDFDAVRHQVGRQLDRIRATRDPGGIPDGSE